MDDQGVIWRNGQLVPFAEATCHVLSHAAARGSQVFDVMLVVHTESGHHGVGLRPHMVRFLRSAESMGMQDVGEIAQLEQAVAETVAANAESADTSPFVVKIIASWAEQAIGLMPADLRPTVDVVAMPYLGERAPAALGPPVAVRSSSMPKIPAEILPPSLKVAASYTPGLREQLASVAQGFDYTVFRTASGDLAESTTLSMLVVSKGRILAPPLDTVLDGITRRIVLDAALDREIPVEVRSVWWDEVTEADELLLCSTTHPVVAVGRLDARSLDAPGPIATELSETVAEILAGDHRLSERWLTPLAPLAPLAAGADPAAQARAAT